VEIPRLNDCLIFVTPFSYRGQYDIDNFIVAHPVLRDVTIESIHSTKKFHQGLNLADRIDILIKYTHEDVHYAALLENGADFQGVAIRIMAENRLMLSPSPLFKPQHLPSKTCLTLDSRHVNCHQMRIGT